MNDSVIELLPNLEKVEHELAKMRRETAFLNSLRRLLRKRAHREQLIQKIVETRGKIEGKE